MRPVLRAAWPALLLVALLLVPFYNKAFTIDDTVFLLEAEQVLHDPLHPTAFELNWDAAPKRLSTLMASGPVMAYVLLPVVLLRGQEWVAHLILGLLVWATVLATVSLALRFGMSAAMARNSGLLCMTAPAVLGMAGTAMPDVPAMAFATLSCERFLAWKQDGKWHQVVAAALLLAGAILTRSHTVMLLLIVPLLLLDEADFIDVRRLPFWRWLPLGLAIVLVGLVVRLTQDPLPQGDHVVGAIHRYSWRSALLLNSMAFFSYFSTCFPLSIPWLQLRGSQLSRGAFAGLTVVAAILLKYGCNRSPFLASLLSLSIVVLYDLFADAWKRRDRLQLILGCWLLVAAPVVLYVHMAPKYLLPSAPAIALLVCHLLARKPGPRPARLPLYAACAGALLGLLILSADARFAGMGRQAAKELIAPMVARGEKVWFIGHWGFQWYAQRAGARCFERDRLPQPGDVVVASAAGDLWHFIELLPNRQSLGSIADEGPGGRTMSTAAGAGFFSNHQGILPWSYSHYPHERFDAFRILPSP